MAEHHHRANPDPYKSGRDSRRAFTAYGRHGHMSGVQYPNGTISYQWTFRPDLRPSTCEDLDMLTKNQLVDVGRIMWGTGT